MRLAGAITLLGVLVALACSSAAEGASGTWVRAWGNDVIQGAPTGFEVCTVAASCKVAGTSAFGGDLADTDGVASDGQYVYVADTGHDRIQKYTLSGDFVSTWGKDVINGGAAIFEVCTVPLNCKTAASSSGFGGEMDAPEGVAVDGAGNVYVGDRLSHRIDKFSSTGGFIAAWGKDVIASGGMNDTGTGYEVCTFAPDCKKGLNTGALGGELNAPNGVASDGSFVYVADRVNNRIQKFDLNGAFHRTWGKDVISGGSAGFEVCAAAATCKKGEASTGLGGEVDFPVGVAADKAGHIYVADTGGSEVQKFDTLGTWERAWGKDVVNGGGTGPEICTAAASCKEGDSSTSLGGELNQPGGIAADAAGVYVSDPYKGRIQEFDPTGRFFLTWGKDVLTGGGTGFETCGVATDCKQAASSTGLGGELQLPDGLALGPGGSLYAGDSGNRRMQQFTAEPPVFPVAAVTKKKKCKKKRKKRKHASAAKKKKCKKKKKHRKRALAIATPS